MLHKLQHIFIVHRTRIRVQSWSLDCFLLILLYFNVDCIDLNDIVAWVGGLHLIMKFHWAPTGAKVRARPRKPHQEVISHETPSQVFIVGLISTSPYLQTSPNYISAWIPPSQLTVTKLKLNHCDLLSAKLNTWSDFWGRTWNIGFSVAYVMCKKANRKS